MVSFKAGGFRSVINLSTFAITFGVVGLLPVDSSAQQPEPAVVRPGAPGRATQKLPSSAKASLPSATQKDIEFMQGMIMHHAQAVEMTAMIESRTENKNIRLLGARISQSQTDEMEFMTRWLELRGQPAAMPMSEAQSSHSHGSHHSPGLSMLMPGMLSPKQMDALKAAKAADFDRLFLTGMIQHHEGALVMVRDLFDSPGAGQDAELFNFASDVDSGQRAEISTMQNLLSGKNVQK